MRTTIADPPAGVHSCTRPKLPVASSGRSTTSTRVCRMPNVLYLITSKMRRRVSCTIKTDMGSGWPMFCQLLAKVRSTASGGYPQLMRLLNAKKKGRTYPAICHDENAPLDADLSRNSERRKRCAYTRCASTLVSQTLQLRKPRGLKHYLQI